MILDVSRMQQVYPVLIEFRAETSNPEPRQKVPPSPNTVDICTGSTRGLLVKLRRHAARLSMAD